MPRPGDRTQPPPQGSSAPLDKKHGVINCCVSQREALEIPDLGASHATLAHVGVYAGAVIVQKALLLTSKTVTDLQARLSNDYAYSQVMENEHALVYIARLPCP